MTTFFALCEVKLLSSGSVAAVVDVVVVHPFPSAAPRKKDSNSDTPKKQQIRPYVEASRESECTSSIKTLFVEQSLDS